MGVRSLLPFESYTLCNPFRLSQVRGLGHLLRLYARGEKGLASKVMTVHIQNCTSTNLPPLPPPLPRAHSSQWFGIPYQLLNCFHFIKWKFPRVFMSLVIAGVIFTFRLGGKKR